MSPPTRSEREAEARRLRAEGLLTREIAERMGVAVSTADAYLNDPGGAKLRARKDGYRGRCVECGTRTDGSRGAALAPSLCMACHEWSPEDCIMAIQRWSNEHGGIPPRCEDWRNTGDGDHPCANTVSKRCGGWNEALLEAGYALHMDRRPETQAWVEDQIRAGVPTADIAAALGVSPKAIHNRILGRGMHVSELRSAAA